MSPVLIRVVVNEREIMKLSHWFFTHTGCGVRLIQIVVSGTKICGVTTPTARTRKKLILKDYLKINKKKNNKRTNLTMFAGDKILLEYNLQN